MLYPRKKGPVTPRDPKLNQGFYVKGVFIVRGKGLHPKMNRTSTQPVGGVLFLHVLLHYFTFVYFLLHVLGCFIDFEVATVHIAYICMSFALSYSSMSGQVALVTFPQCFLHFWVLTGANRSPI